MNRIILGGKTVPLIINFLFHYSTTSFLICLQYLQTFTIYSKLQITRSFYNIKAFKITVKLLNTIARLAIIGFIEMPKGFNNPIATGIIKQL